jgi:hypothetical protein
MIHSDQDVLFAVAVIATSNPLVESVALRQVFVGLERPELLEPAHPATTTENEETLHVLQAIAAAATEETEILGTWILALIANCEETADIVDNALACVQSMRDEVGMDGNVEDPSADDVEPDNDEFDIDLDEPTDVAY